MSGRFFPRVLFALLILAGVAGIGFYGYQLGLAQGAAQSTATGAAAAGAVGPYWYPHPVFPFWGFGCLIPLFFGLLILGGMRAMFWRGHMMGHGGWRGRWSESGVPPMFEEWHNRAHEQKAGTSTEPKPDAKPGK